MVEVFRTSFYFFECSLCSLSPFEVFFCYSFKILIYSPIFLFVFFFYQSILFHTPKDLFYHTVNSLLYLAINCLILKTIDHFIIKSILLSVLVRDNFINFTDFDPVLALLALLVLSQLIFVLNPFKVQSQLLLKFGIVVAKRSVCPRDHRLREHRRERAACRDRRTTSFAGYTCGDYTVIREFANKWSPFTLTWKLGCVNIEIGRRAHLLRGRRKTPVESNRQLSSPIPAHLFRNSHDSENVSILSLHISYFPARRK